jgi:hypothetical protein
VLVVLTATICWVWGFGFFLCVVVRGPYVHNIFLGIVWLVEFCVLVWFCCPFWVCKLSQAALRAAILIWRPPSQSILVLMRVS